ncbi:ribonuclease P protein subunit p20-like [Rhineura floridana]|uniref:ribonuclease P protein subunit p20-like n=1 Tax=Rhineura floridana TaxID=261503 RepID=UPI002AC7EAC9|nr:ribonuclease P protein subunit p20-like [Rhineura floridana]
MGYALCHFLSRRLPSRRSNVFFSMKTDFKAQLSHCQKLLVPGSSCPEICIHSLGLAINHAINIALQLEATGSGSLYLVANTSTVVLADVTEPEGDSEKPLVRTRNNSAIHI